MKSCKKKEYDTFEDAHKARKNYSRWHRIIYSVYLCKHCKKHHLGKPNKWTEMGSLS